MNSQMARKTVMMPVLILLFIAVSVWPVMSQVTTFADEIAGREKTAESLRLKIQQWQQRKSILVKIDKEHRQMLAAKAEVDRKVDDIRQMDRKLQRPASVFDPNYQNDRNRLVKSMHLFAAVGKQPVANYNELTRWIGIYEKESLKNRQELDALEKNLQNAEADLMRAQDEIAILTKQRSLVAAQTALEGDWVLPGGEGNTNIIHVYYNEKDRHYYGTVSRSDNLPCHPSGAILFSVMPVSGSEAEFNGMEYGAEYDTATGKCRAQQARLSIRISGETMRYSNGAQTMTLSRHQKVLAPTLPIQRKQLDSK